MTNINRGYIDIIIFSFFVGLVGICVKSTKNLDALTIAFYRGAIAALFILLLSILLGKGRTLVRRRFGKGMTLNVAGLTLGIGLLQALMQVLYIYSLLLTTVNNAVFLHSTAPIFALIFSRIFLKETITRKTYVGIVLVMAGTCVIVDPRNLSLHSAESIGNIIALASGLFYGAMAVTSKSLSPKVDGYYQVFWQYMIVALLILPFANLGMNTFPTHSFAVVGDPAILMVEPTWKDTLFVHNLTLNWVPLSLLGIFGSGVCYIFFVRGVKTVPANHIMLAAGLEPVFGALIATLYLGEVFSTLTTVGAALILAGIYQISMRDADRSTAGFGKSVAERTQKIKGASNVISSDNIVQPVRQYPIVEHVEGESYGGLVRIAHVGNRLQSYSQPYKQTPGYDHGLLYQQALTRRSPAFTQR